MIIINSIPVASRKQPTYTRIMSPTILAIRAVTSTYAQGLLWLPLFIGCAIYAVIMVIIGLVAYASSAWWWLLAIGPTIIFLVALTIWIVVYLFAKGIAPPMNKRQRKATKQFVGRLSTAAEHLATPKFVLIFRVIRDMMMRPTSDRTLIGTLAHEPGEMRREFEELRKLFS